MWTLDLHCPACGFEDTISLSEGTALERVERVEPADTRIQALGQVESAALFVVYTREPNSNARVSANEAPVARLLGTWLPMERCGLSES